MPPTFDSLDRALGALVGGALGDALGMPTQTLSSTQIEALYGHVEDFVAPTADHPVSKGLPAGTVTDDTEQTLLLGSVLLNSASGFDQRRWVDALTAWERDVRGRGGYDLLGPSTKRAINAIKDGVPVEEAGRFGTTNGAAMRIAPVGILMPPQPLDALITKVADTCRATHNTPFAINAAVAVAGAVSCGVSGGDWRAAADLGVMAAKGAAREDNGTAGADIGARIASARELVRGRATKEAARSIVEQVGTGVAAQETVPAAFAVLELASGDAWRAAVIGANLGGDTDTIGAIAAGMAGACSGFAALPADKVASLRGFDPDEARRLAARLLAGRSRARNAFDGKDTA